MVERDRHRGRVPRRPDRHRPLVKGEADPPPRLVREAEPAADHRRRPAQPQPQRRPEWGETVNNAIRVWRSGLGIDSRGNLLYAAANYQTVESLAKILQRAGAVRALELDINEDWTSFISYRHPGAGEPSNLLPEMFRPPERYLTPDERDFFAVYLRPGQRW